VNAEDVVLAYLYCCGYVFAQSKQDIIRGLYRVCSKYPDVKAYFDFRVVDNKVKCEVCSDIIDKLIEKKLAVRDGDKIFLSNYGLKRARYVYSKIPDPLKDVIVNTVLEVSVYSKKTLKQYFK